MEQNVVPCTSNHRNAPESGIHGTGNGWRANSPAHRHSGRSRTAGTVSAPRTPASSPDRTACTCRGRVEGGRGMARCKELSTLRRVPSVSWSHSLGHTVGVREAAALAQLARCVAGTLGVVARGAVDAALRPVVRLDRAWVAQCALAQSHHVTAATPGKGGGFQGLSAAPHVHADHPRSATHLYEPGRQSEHSVEPSKPWVDWPAGGCRNTWGHGGGTQRRTVVTHQRCTGHKRSRRSIR